MCKSVDMWIVEKSGQKTRVDLAWSYLYWILDKCHLGWLLVLAHHRHHPALHPDNLHTSPSNTRLKTDDVGHSYFLLSLSSAAVLLYSRF